MKNVVNSEIKAEGEGEYYYHFLFNQTLFNYQNICDIRFSTMHAYYSLINK